MRSGNAIVSLSHLLIKDPLQIFNCVLSPDPGIGVVTTWTDSGLTCLLSLLPCHSLQAAFIPFYTYLSFHFLDTR